MIKRPTAQDIKDLRTRHGISQKELSLSLYEVKADRVADWENGRRNCTPIVWWAMKLIWDKEDIWERDCREEWEAFQERKHR